MRSVFLVTTLNVLIVITQNYDNSDTLFTTCYNTESCYFLLSLYRSGTVNSKSFVGKVLLRIKRKFELN